MKKNFLLPLTLLIFQSAAIAQDENLDSTLIRDLIAAYAEAREVQDPQTIRKLFTSDADQLVSSGTWRRGREVLVTGMMSSSKNHPGSRSIEVERVRMISPTVAIADARYTIKGSNGRPDRKMWSTFVAVKNEKDWRLSAIRNMLPARRN